jgi:MFS family permease
MAGAIPILAILAPATSLFITATAMPSVVADLGGLSIYAWTSIAYSVASIVGSAGTSAIAQRLGLRAGLVASSVIFIAGSLTCGFAPTMAVIVGGRALQGIGGGMIVGVVHAMIRVVFPAHLWPRRLASVSLAWGVAALTGPFLGGLLAERGLWRAAFWLMIPVVAMSGALAWRILPARGRATLRGSPPFGRLGLICAAVVCLALVGNTRGAGARAVLLGAMALAIVAALRLDTRAVSRLFPSGMLSLRAPLGRCFWTIFLIAMSASPIGVYMALLLQTAHGASPAVAGYIFAAHSLAWTTAAMITARLSEDRVRTALVLGPIVMTIGLVALCFTMRSGPAPAILAAIVVEGSGIGLCWAHIGNVVMGTARADEEAATAAMIPSAQLFAVAFGAALSAIIASAAGLTREASPEVAAATGQALFGVFAVTALVASVIASRIVPAPAR